MPTLGQPIPIMELPSRNDIPTIAPLNCALCMMWGIVPAYLRREQFLCTPVTGSEMRELRLNRTQVCVPNLVGCAWTAAQRLCV
jgi:hypothetical protein